MGSFRSRLLLTTILALLAALLAAPAAFALRATVRIEAAPFTLASSTNVQVSPTARFFDSIGNPYGPTFFVVSDGGADTRVYYASALSALAATAKAQGFTWEAAYGGNFITQIGGFGSLPDFSQGWIYAVNGAGYPIVDVGALDFRLRDQDAVLFAQSPDATFTRHGKALMVRFNEADRAYETGQPVVATVYADDLEKVNSSAQADRFKVDASFVETPDQFQPVAGATLHIGSRTAVTDASGRVELTDVGAGTYRVWAERDMDASSFYVRAPQRAINMADPLALTGLTARPDPFTPGHTVRFGFTLSRSATVKYTVRSRSGALIASLTRRLAGGAGTLRWSGDNAAGRPVRPGTYRVRLTATDTWGRSATPLTTTVVAR